ncbi:hypothetical protein, partial [Shewanella sp.]|uniref:hypothetical protein n=1 Tax=Shewanella sp. TaxID=50422 RepID=UPI004047AACA
MTAQDDSNITRFVIPALSHLCHSCNAELMSFLQCRTYVTPAMLHLCHSCNAFKQESRCSLWLLN